MNVNFSFVCSIKTVIDYSLYIHEFCFNFLLFTVYIVIVYKLRLSANSTE